VLGNEYPRWMTVRRVPATVRDDRTRRTDRLIHSKAADLRRCVYKVAGVLSIYSAGLPRTWSP